MWQLFRVMRLAAFVGAPGLPRLVASGAGVSVVCRMWASLIAARLAQHHLLHFCRKEKPRRNLGSFVPVSQALPTLAWSFAHVVPFKTVA